tara:strand:- start:2090 stop:2272 length:183 start_codon:yes stop_codon:yes gene_type:complete
MNIKEAKYHKNEITKENVSIFVTLNNSNALMSVPMDEDNTDYAEILKLVKEGKLTIKDAD